MLRLLLFILACTSANIAIANVINFDGIEYQAVDWNSASTVTNMATGDANGITVTLSAFDMASDSISSADYSTDPTAFGNLNFPGSAILESVSLFGVPDFNEFDTVNFSSPVDSILMIIGSPNTTADAPQYGPSRWDFDDNLTLTVVDDESSGFEILSGNILNAIGVTGPGNHISGVIRVSGTNLNSVSWQHVLDSTGNTDKMDITFAVNQTVIPIPAAAWLFGSALLGFVSIARYKRA